MNLELYVGVEKEKKANTTEMLKMNVTDVSIKENISTVDSNVISNGRFKSSGFIGSKRVSGSMSLEPTLLELETLLQGAGFKAVETNGADNKHTRTYTATETYETPLTVILNLIVKNFKEQTDSCLVDSLSLGLALESYVKLEAEVKGMAHKKEEGKHTVTNAITNNGKRLTCLGVVVKKGDTDISAKIESADIRLSNSLEERGAINKVHTQEIIQNGQGEVSVTLNYNQLDKDEYLKADKLLSSNGETTLEITLAEDITVEKQQLEKTKQVVIKLPNVKYKNNEMGDLSGHGSLTQELGAYPNAEGQPIEFIFKNMDNSMKPKPGIGG
ncbi:phage tail tube protein [Streptobacillus moniliformis]|uniref:phage tail tube protein n=1 Tax=Streptobacillus moniliformis TaxID=34105 RepID=UPI0007E4576D|nr:phage tail tube protein [Streptobacillus moniliformis]